MGRKSVAWPQAAGAPGSHICPETKMTKRHSPEIIVTMLCDDETRSLAGEGRFSCLVESGERKLLFDTGCDPQRVLRNLEALECLPSSIDSVVVSSRHHDLLPQLVARLHRGVEVWLPASYSTHGEEAVKNAGGVPRRVQAPRKLCADVFTLGELVGYYYVQIVAVCTAEGVNLIGELGPPGVRRIRERVDQTLPGASLYLALGNFDNGRFDELEIYFEAEAFRDAGVKKVCPARCSGNVVRALLRDAFQEDYMELPVRECFRWPGPGRHAGFYMSRFAGD
ncbi:MAG: hypothetical protein D6743_09820 [Calditrichaeota bacterium]|nr:MAG: hypothetical protein D6743_09820 [Calditrichota bacterium]